MALCLCYAAAEEAAEHAKDFERKLQRMEQECARRIRSAEKKHAGRCDIIKRAT